MDIQNKIKQYSCAIWNEQLPKEEEMFLYDLIQGKASKNYKYNIDSDYSLFLAYNASKHNYDGYDENQVVSLKRVLNTYTVQKLRKLPSMAKVFRLLNANGIIPVLIKGVALMCYYAPDIPRMMGDIDFYIKPEQFNKALSLLYDNGFEYLNDTGYHVAITSDNLDIDVHRYIYKNGGDIGSDIYERLIQCTFLGCNVYVLSPEDMLVHQLANRGEDICTRNHVERHFKWIVDCYQIMKFCSPSIDTMIQKAKHIKNFYYVQLTLSKLADLFPELFEDGYPSISDKKYLKWIKYASKNISALEKCYNNNVRGVRYIISYKLCGVWRKARMEKLVSRRNDSVLKIMLINLGINTAGDFLYRLHRVIKNSIKGVSSNNE